MPIFGLLALALPAFAQSITVTSTPATCPTPAAGGSSYSCQFNGTGGTLPYTWSISSGALPAGLNLGSSSGTLSGVPTAAGTFTFTVRATGGIQGQKTVTIVVTAPTITGFTSQVNGAIPPLAPGSLVVMSGTGLAGSIASTSPPYPTTLGNVSVTINGTPAPIFSVSSTQIILQIPLWKPYRAQSCRAGQQ